MTVSWDQYWQFLVEWEGSKFENDPSDDGNKGDGSPGNYGTKYGVDAASHPGVDIVNLTESQASQIYESEFNQGPFANLPSPINYVCFDFGMNAGTSRAVKCLQLNVGTTTDGQWGPKSQVAFDKTYSEIGNQMIPSLIECRKRYYSDLAGSNSRLAKYRQGWLNRCNALQEWVDSIV